MDLGFTGKVAMVAASSKGLGFGIAQELAREGASVSIASRTQADIENAAAQLRDETGASVLATAMDATKPDDIQNWIQRTLAEFGGVDALVANAGGPPPGQFDDFSDDDWQNAFELNVMSGVRMIRGVLPSMRERGGGSILTVTSSSVKEPIDILILSNVMRSGTTGLVKSLSLQLAPDNIRVNNLMPGRMDTDRVRSADAFQAQKLGITPEQMREKSQASLPWKRYGTIEEFGKTGAFLLSDAASYITGSSVAVDGGMIRTVW